jgi:hypothetical protein
MQPLDWAASGKKGVFIAPYRGFPGRYWHLSSNPEVQDFHRQSACPDQFVYVSNEKTIEYYPVFSEASLTPGTFYVEGWPHKPAAVLVMPHESINPDEALERLRRHLRASGSPMIAGPMTAEVWPEGVTLQGMKFAYCGSTHKRGAVHMGPRWAAVDCSVTGSVGAGIRFYGSDARLLRVESYRNGQCSFYGENAGSLHLLNVETYANNTRGADPQHEAGGKLVSCRGARIEGFRSVDDPRPIWFDVSSDSPVITQFDIQRPTAAGIQIEHGCSGFRIENGTITDVVPYVYGGRVRRFGVQLQSRLRDGLVFNVSINGADIGILYKKHERRGGSAYIDGREITFSDCAADVEIETMSDSEIISAIRAGALPADLAEWKLPDYGIFAR